MWLVRSSAGRTFHDGATNLYVLIITNLLFPIRVVVNISHCENKTAVITVTDEKNANNTMSQLGGYYKKSYLLTYLYTYRTQKKLCIQKVKTST